MTITLHPLTPGDVMSQPSPMSEQERSDLVAFLDGELAGEAARKMETRLSQDATVRAEADALKRAWDLLDFLPKPEPSPSFTHRTLDRISPVRLTASQTAAATGLTPSGGSGWWTLALASGWMLCLMLAGVAGYVAYEALVPAPSPAPSHEGVSPAPEPDKPSHLSEFAPDVQAFVNDQLMPMLSDEEKQSLRRHEGKWPDYPYALMRVASKHEVLPPIRDTVGPTKWDTLPEKWKKAFPRRKLENAGILKNLNSLSGKWPDFALAMTDLAHKEMKAFPKAALNLSPLGASQPKEFSPTVQTFLEEKLLLALSESERKKLTETEGKWPEYPRLLIKLASKHHLVIPGMMLPDF
jgi:hypothetical protein